MLQISEILMFKDFLTNFPPKNNFSALLQPMCGGPKDHSQINVRSREVQIEPRVAHFPFCRIIYNIGQVCYIKSLGKNCVITGWKRNCALNECLDISDGLSVKSSHIFYRVLGDNGYVGDEVQENLIPISPVLIINDEVGKFFESFVPRLGYIPNVECAKWFPEKHSEPS